MSVILSFFEAKERILQTPSKKADPDNNKYYLSHCPSVLH